ncbi:MAG: type II secretion system protein M [Lachnospiraceae bacterium]|nr:type II secretion system protein M [Lachnospiraceae bacterium]
MSDRDKKLLVYLGALIIVAAAYFLVGKPFLDKIDQQTAEKTQLTQELNEKRKAFENKEMYEQGIVDATNKINAIIDEFPEDNADEKSIMFASVAEREVPIWFSQMKFAEETRNMINGGETESASDVEQQQLEENVAAAEGEEVPSDTEGAEAGGGENSEGSTGINNLMYRDTELGLTFQTQYDGFKNLLAYVRDYEDRMVIKEIDISFEPMSGMVSGSMVLSQYAILSPERTLPDVVTDVDNLGTDNIFVNGNYGGTIIDLLADVAADFVNKLMGGLSPEALDEYGTDYFVKVNAVTDNTNGKTIGRADDTSEATYITSSTDGKEDVIFRVSGSGGSYSVYYKIGKAEYTDTIEKASDGKIYLRIVSTARMDDSDQSAVSLHVTNESDIPVVVNVEGDDSNNPRVTIQERAGNVTVNGQ